MRERTLERGRGVAESMLGVRHQPEAPPRAGEPEVVAELLEHTHRALGDRDERSRVAVRCRVARAALEPSVPLEPRVARGPRCVDRIREHELGRVDVAVDPERRAQLPQQLDAGRMERRE